MEEKDNKIKKFLEDQLNKLKDHADINPESDLPVTEKKTKEKITKE